MRLASFVLVCLFGGILAAPWLTPLDPQQTDLLNTLAAPSLEHWLGTDELGRDVLSRVLYGGRTTLLIATTATAIATVWGLGLGSLAAFSNKWLDALLGAIITVALSIPPLIAALVLLTLLGRGIGSVALATGITQIAYLTQVTQATIRQIRHQGYVEASSALGAGRSHILFAHILPNSRNVLVAYVFIVFAYSIINSAGLSLLGLGPAPGTPEWGVMLAESRSAFRYAPWVAIAPGVCLSALVIALNQLARHFTLASR